MMMVFRDRRDEGDRADAQEQAVSAFVALGERIQATRHGARSHEAFPPEGAETLHRIIEGEIIPRLMLAHAAPPGASTPDGDTPIQVTPEDRTRLLDVVTAGSPAASRALVEELRLRGVPRELIFLDLLAFVARRLGELWEADRIDFTAVTIGLCRLHEVLREQSLPSEHHPGDAGDGREHAPRILLATACGDQHVFGVVMVSEFFRRAGWRVAAEPGASEAQLVELVQQQHFDLVGLSAACTALAGSVRDEIAALRKASCNRDLKVLVGGRLFAEAPELVREVGADAAAFDAQTAPDAGKSLLARVAVRC